MIDLNQGPDKWEEPDNRGSQPDGPSNETNDVKEIVDERIRREALRQLESIHCDDDDWRIEPLPSFDVERADELSGTADPAVAPDPTTNGSGPA